MINLPILEDLENLDPRRGDLQTCLSQVIVLQCGDLSTDSTIACKLPADSITDLTSALQLPILPT